jgi:hypothetical protein
MPIKEISKSYNYIIPTAREYYEKFKQEMLKAKLPDSYQSRMPWTELIKGISSEIGTGYGFNSNQEYLRLDQTWEIRLPDISCIALALEVENTDNIEDLLDDELQKLIDVKAYLKVLIFYPELPIVVIDGKTTYPAIEDKIKSALMKCDDERYLIITIQYLDSKKKLAAMACELDSESKSTYLGAFSIPYKSTD